MGTHPNRFRDRLPLSPLTLPELVEQRTVLARIIANCVVDDTTPAAEWLTEYRLVRDATRLRLGLPVFGTVHRQSEMRPRE